jgi:hypothetical protein
VEASLELKQASSISELASIVRNYPNTSVAAEAKQRLAKMCSAEEQQSYYDALVAACSKNRPALQSMCANLWADANARRKQRCNAAGF